MREPVETVAPFDPAARWLSVVGGRLQSEGVRTRGAVGEAGATTSGQVPDRPARLS